MSDKVNANREEAYRKVVNGHNAYERDIADVAREIQRLEQEAGLLYEDKKQDKKQEQPIEMTHSGQNPYQPAGLESGLDEYEPDPFAELTAKELEQLEVDPEKIDFAALSIEQQNRYWSLLSPGEKLRLVRSHLEVHIEVLANEARLPLRVIRLLEQDQFQALPSAAQTVGYYEAYCQVLGMESEPLIEQYEALSGKIADMSDADQSYKDFNDSFALKFEKYRLPLLALAFLVVGFGLGWLVVASQSDPVSPPPLDEQPTGGVTYSSPDTISNEQSP